MTDVPEHLSEPAQAWCEAVEAEFELEEFELSLLYAAAQAWDRMEEARVILAKDGILTEDRYGALKAHPAVAIERDAAAGFARMLRQLHLGGNAGPGGAA